MIPNPQFLYSQNLRADIEFFSLNILGIPLHEGQKRWIKNSDKKINILRPGNRWGKTMVEAIKHIHQLMTKPKIQENVMTPTEWMEMPYETLNFGPGYEQAREVPRLMRDIIEGKIMFPRSLWSRYGKTNNSLLKGWAIAEDRVEQQTLPNLKLITGGNLLIRSYSEMGAAFKAKALAFISGDECADIAELWTFTNVTLLPRLVSMKGSLDFVGTVQQEGYDYMQMIEMAEEDMENHPPTGEMFYVQKGSMYDNEFLDRDEIKKTESIADESIRLQIIEGEYVEAGDKYFGFDRVNNLVDKNLRLQERGFDGRKYLTSVDFAGGESKWSDFTVIKVIDYTQEPYELVYFFRIKGSQMPIPMQYEKVREVYALFYGKLIIDGSGLGGKNAAAYLRDLNPIVIDITAKLKAEIISTLKVAMDGNQSKKRKRQVENIGGEMVDKNPDWGLIRIPFLPDVINELNNYKLDDKKIRNDCVMTLAQAIWWIEMRRPKMKYTQMMEVDWGAII